MVLIFTSLAPASKVYPGSVVYTGVSRVSAHGRLNVIRDSGLHGHLLGIKMPYICIEAATLWYMGAYPGVCAYPGHYSIRIYGKTTLMAYITNCTYC